MAKKFGRYELVRELGRGGQAVVYEAHDPELRRSVALKVLLPGTRSLNSAQRFVREARAAAKLKHANIISIYEVGEWQSRHYMAMEKIDGGSLADLLASHRPEPRKAVEIVKQVAEAVQCAHEAGIIHRDIKSANILMDAEGRPRLTDFGFALDAEAQTQITQSGAVMGTPAYMPPEQAKGHAHAVDVRSDVYSLGAVLYEALTGHMPFEAETSLMLLRQIVHEQPRKPSELQAGIPRDASTICLKCLEKEPKRRYQTAGELAEDCGRFLAGEAIAARPASVLYLARKGLARHRGLALGLVSVILALLVGLAAAIQQWRAVNAALVQARESAKKARENEAKAREAETRAKAALARAEAERQRAVDEQDRAEAAEEKLTGTLAKIDALLKKVGASTAELEEESSQIEETLVGIQREIDAKRWQEAWNLISLARQRHLRPPSLRTQLDEHSKLVRAKLTAKPPLGLEFALVSGGEFLMGSSLGQPDEMPVRKVTVSHFYMGRHEVTKGQFEAFRQGRPELSSHDSPAKRRPVVSVSWDEAVDFCKYLSSLDRNASYRLPTEAEWEYAARGRRRRKYPWGDGPPTAEHANLAGDADGYARLAPVGSFQRGTTHLGIFDLAGNAAEWCADWYGVYEEGIQQNPTGPVDGTKRVVRGGAFELDATWIRSTARACREPDQPSELLGFRVVRELTDGNRGLERQATL